MRKSYLVTCQIFNKELWKLKRQQEKGNTVVGSYSGFGDQVALLRVIRAALLMGTLQVGTDISYLEPL